LKFHQLNEPFDEQFTITIVFDSWTYFCNRLSKVDKTVAILLQ